MARILAYNAPATGHIYPCTGVLLELLQRGHDVYARTRSSDVAMLAGLGVNATAIDASIEAIEIDDWKAKNSLDALERLHRAMAARGVYEFTDLSEAIQSVRPDVLLVDANCPGAGLMAETTNLPWAQYCPFPPAFGSKDAPPYGPGLAPAHGPIGRARNRLAARILRRRSRRHLTPLNATRSDLGLEPLAELGHSTARADRVIMFTSEPFEYPRRDWPDAVRLVGPLLWEPATDPPAWLASEDRPIVLVTASTVFQADAVLIQTTLDALRDDDVAVVATTGAHDPTPFTAPPNARVEQFLAHGPILQRAACVVSHGGMGITQKALAAGVPVCVVPFCRDQFEVARRVQTAHAGTRLHHKRLTPKRLRDAVHAAIDQRAGAKRVADSFARAGGASAAADTLEELLAARPSQGVTDSDSSQIGPAVSAHCRFGVQTAWRNTMMLF
jgi:MGT family glycosyltransferase